MADDIIGTLGVQIEADASDLPGQYDQAVAASENAAERIATAFESIVGIGEALAITEGLKEFSTEALNAFGTVQSVTIGLTQLTKSADDANEIIGQIKELADSEPFAFPDLAPTVQKMVALGVSTEQIPGVMQAAADAAAATGNSFDAVAGAIDRMSLSGTVSARSLVQLGVSTEDLGRVMGVTADEVKTAFAALDQSQRIDVLTTALEKFAGSAEAQAKGIAGEWQIFKNQFEEVMVDVGQAIAPTAELILSFGRDAISIIQPVIEAFNKLPDPIKQVAEVAGLAFIALGPLQTVFEAIGISAGEAALAQAAETTATELQGEAAATTATELEDLAIAEAGVGEAAGVAATEVAASGEAAATAGIGITAAGAAATAAGAALATFVGYEIGKWAQDNIPGLVELERHLIDFASTYLPNFGEALDHVKQQFNLNGEASKSEADEIQSLQGILRQAGVSLQQFGDDNEHFIQVLRDARQAIADTGSEIQEGYGPSVDALIDKQSKLNTAEQQAAANLLVVKQLYADGAVSLDVLNAAYADYQKAVDASNASNKNFKDSLAGISEAYDKQQATISTLETTYQQLIASQDGTQRSASLLLDVENKLAAAYGAHKTSIDNLPKAYDGLVTSADAFAKKEKDVSDAVGYAKSVLDGAIASSDGSAQAQKVVNDALTQYVDKLKASGAALTDQITINVRGVDVVTTLGNAIDMVKKQQGDWNTATINGVQVTKDHQVAATNATPAITNLGKAVAQVADDTSKAINYNSPFAASLQNVATSATTVDNSSRSAATSVDKLGADAAGNVDNMSRFANSISQVTNAVNTMAGGMSSADKTMSDFAHGLNDDITGLTMSTQTLMGWYADIAKGLIPGLTAGPGVADQINKYFQSLGYQGDITQGFTIRTAQQNTDAAAQQQAVTDAYNAQQQAQAQSDASDKSFIQSLVDIGVSAAQAATVLDQLKTESDSSGKSLSSLESAYTSAEKASNSTASATANNTTALNAKATANVTAASATTTATAAVTSLTAATDQLAASAADAQKAAVAAETALRQQTNLVDDSSVTTTDALGNVTTAYTSTAAAGQAFVDGLGNVYNSYQALVDAIKANPLLAGPATSSTGPISGTLDAVTQAAFAAARAQSAAGVSGPGAVYQTGGSTGSILPNILANGITASNGLGLGDVLALQNLGVGSGSGGSTLGQSPFTNQAPSAPQPIVVNLHYPQFNTQQQAQQVITQVVQQLRTVTGLKL